MNEELKEFLCRQLDPNPELWSKRVYKGTTCGAWIKVEASTVTLGSIVEGTCLEVGPIVLTWPFPPALFWNTLEEIEDEAEKIWKLTHGCDGCAEKWMTVSLSVDVMV
jgi:hypothetical protein